MSALDVLRRGAGAEFFVILRTAVEVAAPGEIFPNRGGLHIFRQSHRQDCPPLDKHIEDERLTWIDLPSEEPGCKHKVAGRGYREKFRRPLDDAEDERLKKAQSSLSSR